MKLISKAIAGSCILSLLLIFTACESEESKKLKALPKDKLFTKVPSKLSGLRFKNKLTDNFKTRQNILGYEYFYNGAGVSIGDINNDGLPDILMTGNMVSNKLYLNKGNLQFEDITKKAGLHSKHWATGATMADVNQDGYLDIYVCNSGYKLDPNTRPNQFYVNNGDLTFTESAKAFGIQDKNYSTQSAFFDYDGDGDLDLYVMNHSVYYEMPLQKVFELIEDEAELKKVSNKLFRNNGDNSFTDVTKEAGLLNYGFGLGLVISDINTDGLPDIYVTNDYDVPDFMYINQGDGSFADKIKKRTKHVSWFGMGCDIADINNDGAMEIGVVDMTPSDHFRSKTLMKSMNTDLAKFLVKGMKRQHQYMFNSLQLNNGDNFFSDIALMANVAKTDWSWSALFSDLDNDGYKDYFVTNGFRKYFSDNDFQNKLDKMLKQNPPPTKQEMDALISGMPDVKIPNVLYKNNGDLTFDNISKEAGLDIGTYSNGASIADLDGDGDLDLVINNIDQTMLLYRNNSESLNDNNFLQLKMEGQAMSSKATIYYGDQEIQVQELSATRGYQSSLPYVLHFGLGKHTSVDSLMIQWVDGTIQKMNTIKVNQLLTINKQASGEKIDEKKSYLVYMENHNLFGLNFVHKENQHDDYAVEVLLPHSQSQLGPFSATGDINGDGLEDIFVGGAKDQPAVIFIQNNRRKFDRWESPALINDSRYEDMDALFFDADNDNDLDLYVVSGGGSDFELNSPLLQDRLYLNDGKGNLTKSKGYLPKMISSGMKVKAHDIDQDGDLDLFVGGRTSPGQYPYTPKSYLLENKKGKFTDISSTKGKGLQDIGMVTDFVWSDFNGDKVKDLIVVGEWMPISYFANKEGVLINQTAEHNPKNISGWWYSIEASDLDNDGDDDYILGNIGLNNKFHPSEKKPLNIYANDFDQNGKYDIVLSSYYRGKEVPMRGKECSTQQIPEISDKFPSYESFANASLEDVYGKQNLEEGLHLQANMFHSIALMNDDGTMNSIELPNGAQKGPINKTLIIDLNKDGNKDLIVGGNMFNVEFETTRYDASIGSVLFGDGKGNFEIVDNKQSNLFLPLDLKDMNWITLGKEKKKYFIVTNNNKMIQLGSIIK
mgnify:CR=1 FL=1